MPDLCIELHLGWLKGVLVGDDDVYYESSAIVACVRRSKDGSFPVFKVVAYEICLNSLLTTSILCSFLELFQLLHNATVVVHCV